MKDKLLIISIIIFCLLPIIYTSNILLGEKLHEEIYFKEHGTYQGSNFEYDGIVYILIPQTIIFGIGLAIWSYIVLKTTRKIEYRSVSEGKKAQIIIVCCLSIFSLTINLMHLNPLIKKIFGLYNL